ncbi:unnamed protein product [Rangifer tarandus platyrhynchus]|uniref:Uncharacterized protein n=1 Tax=Rangifer tarandus platyrhynchus TaxID=3082113 RepID=A0ABN9A2C5_RANTA|nr:unnamed protein product [Rangifer tarandus platyrhynchus]
MSVRKGGLSLRPQAPSPDQFGGDQGWGPARFPGAPRAVVSSHPRAGKARGGGGAALEARRPPPQRSSVNKLRAQSFEKPARAGRLPARSPEFGAERERPGTRCNSPPRQAAQRPRAPPPPAGPDPHTQACPAAGIPARRVRNFAPGRPRLAARRAGDKSCGAA